VAGLLPGELRPADAPADPELDRVRDRRRCSDGRSRRSPGSTRQGEPVRLRPMRPADIPSMIAACRDPLSRAFTTVPDPYDEADAESFLYDYAPTVWARGVEAVFAVADGDDAYVGSMSLRLPEDAMTTTLGDVGYLIGPWARRRGYAPAALRLLCDWGFERLALRRIEWRAFVGNDAHVRSPRGRVHHGGHGPGRPAPP
jgi:RimJ/RimL family protein N-acetyltransferase